MKPYSKEFIIDTINEYNSKINEGVSGNCKIIKKKYTKESIEGYMYKSNDEFDVEIPTLLEDDKLWMKMSPKEIQGSYEAIDVASGKVGIVGLGLGYVAQEMAKKTNVTEIIVYEISEDIIKLYKNNFGESNKIKIVQGNAFEAKKEEFDFFFVDIYGYELTAKVVEDYIQFNKIHEIKEYSFWGMEHFLLGCSYEEIVWVFIPEVWMAMSKDLSAKFDVSGYIKYYERLDEKLVSDTLALFKEVFNEGEEEYS